MIDKKNKIRPPPHATERQKQNQAYYLKKNEFISFLNSSAGKETLKKSAEHNLEKKKRARILYFLD